MVDLADACDVLNVTNRNRQMLQPYKAGDHNRGWLFAREHLEKIAVEVVTSAELQALQFMPSKTTLAAVRRAKLAPKMFGYERSGAIEKFDAALPR